MIKTNVGIIVFFRTFVTQLSHNFKYFKGNEYCFFLFSAVQRQNRLPMKSLKLQTKNK